MIPPDGAAGNRRHSTESQVREVLRLQQAAHPPTRIGDACRVSRAAQTPDVLNQRNVLEVLVVAKGLANVEFIEEAGSGSQVARRRFLELMDAVGRRDITTLILAHTDRLIRFGFA